MKSNSIVCCVIALLLSMNCFAVEVDQSISELEKYIGGYPPNIDSETTKKHVVSLYESTKAELDKQLAKQPKSEALLFQRGNLQSMGHNMDYQDAWKGAEADLKLLLTLNPNHIAGVLELGNMYVNTGPEYSEKAMNLFIAAQCLSGSEPNEVAQRGLFFAFYYQGKIPAAYKQLQILNKYWPGNETYQHLEKMTWERFSKEINAGEVTEPSKVVFSSCEKPAKAS